MKPATKTSLLHCAFTSKTTMQQAPANDATSYATTTQHAPQKPASLLDLARNKLRNNHATSSKKVVQQAHSKEEVVVAHENEEIDKPQDPRRAKILSLLESNASLKYAALVDDATTDPVTVTVGIRKIAVFELEIPHAHYDGLALLQILEEHCLKKAEDGDTQASTDERKHSMGLPNERRKTA